MWIRNGNHIIDNEELSSYRRVFGDSLAKLPIINVRRYTGEGRAASAALSCAHAALMLGGDIASSKAYLVSSNIKETTVEAKNLQTILVTAYGSGGSYCAVVLKK